MAPDAARKASSRAASSAEAFPAAVLALIGQLVDDFGARRSQLLVEREQAAQRGALIPLGHPGEVEDVAEAVAYLASDAAKHMTGQTLHVNGGRIMH